MSTSPGIHESFQLYHDIQDQWARVYYRDREESLELAARLVTVADDLANRTRGRALSIQGYALVQNGELDTAERRLLEALALQRDDPQQAATFRHLSFLRVAQRDFRQAEYFANMAMKIDEQHHLQEMIGKDHLMLGFIEYMRGGFDRAVALFLDSMQYLESQSGDFTVATQNFLSALTKCGNPDTVKSLLPSLESYCRQPSDDLTKNRMQWMVANAHLRVGNSRRATEILARVVEFLRERGTAPEIATCYIDQAEAFYRDGDFSGATRALGRAYDYLTATYGLASEQAKGLRAAIKTQCKEFSPWEVRGTIPLQA